MAFGERFDDEGINLLEEFGMAYVGGDLPDWFYLV